MEKLFYKKQECFGCGSCSIVCKERAITMRRDEEGFAYPVIDTTRCVECGACAAVCPAKHSLDREKSKFYAVRCNDLKLLQMSTSGGAFSLIAQEIIESDGLVCGACFDNDFRVKHILSDEIKSMRKSKYVQSDICDCFIQIRDALAAGRRVLFSGTPCQCHAMKLFLGEKQDHIIYAALVCRGVQSPGLWEDYAAWLAGDALLEAYDFRDKRVLNDGHTVAYIVNGEETAVPWGEDKMSRIYSKCISLRPSCYECPYCNPDISFDFTLGDFWGIERICPEFADGRGTSLVIVRGKEAKEIIKKICSKAQVVPCKKKYALQPAIEEAAKTGILRKLLFKDFGKKDSRGHSDISMILKKYGA